MKTNSKQGMEFSIDRIPGQWLFFARDWRPKSTAAPEALCVLTDAMDGLLHAQQTTSDLWKRGARLDTSQQFIAAFGVSQWQPANESIIVDQTSQAINYSYQADGQTCFRGSFSSILGPDDLGTCRDSLTELDPQLTLHKLHQFYALFPWAERLWIYLNTVVTSHFLVDYLKDPSYEIGEPYRLSTQCIAMLWIECDVREADPRYPARKGPFLRDLAY